MEDYPLVSLITLNYNTPAITLEFLDSVAQSNYKNFEVILVDNGSTQKMDKIALENQYPWLNIIVSTENLGFTGGNNLGIEQAKGDYFLIINNDTVLGPNLIHNLLQAFKRDPLIGVVCPKILYFDEPDTIQYAGYTGIHPITSRNKTIGSGQKDKGQFNTPGFTKGAHGACMMVSREVVNTVGAFYEPFFLYYEEVDWSARILRSGFKIYYEPSVYILHKESSSTGRLSPLKTYYLTRNRILYMKRNSNAFEFFGFTLYYLFLVIPKTILVLYLKEKDSRRGEAFWNGTFDGFKIKSQTL